MPWDVFCSVIDNSGDIGVTWRLARQLAREHGIPVRLWVDDLAAFRHIRPEIDPALDTQYLAGVEIRRWTAPLAAAEPGEVVIEALACNLPDEFLARMVAHRPPPVWLNLEYLSAEDWVAGVHGLPSPHPRLPLNKFFFMPGYTAQTGGLTRESQLSAERDVFQSAGARPASGNGCARAAEPALFVPPEEISADALRVSLFSYENRALPSLLHAWASGEQAVHVMVPLGKAMPQIAAWFGESAPTPGRVWRRGALTLRVLPMLDQDTYDRLLWTCDINFVRGEDSFVRAQFAARPLVWQAYVQDEDAHLAKLDAFLDRYCAGLDERLAAQTRSFWRAWNEQTDLGARWPRLRAALPALTAHARAWDTELAAQTDLATNLLTFCRKWLK
jgi:uncharacterized repeat protein (TIGR03837 family)